MQTSFVKEHIMTIAQFMLGQAEGGLCSLFEICALDLSVDSNMRHDGACASGCLQMTAV